MVAIDYKEVVFTFADIIRGVGDAHDVILDGVHDIHVSLEAGAEAAVVVFFQLDGEGDDAVLRQRGDVADGALQFVTADLDNGFAAGGDAVTIGVGYLTFDLEM